MEPFVLKENNCFDEIQKLYDESFPGKLKIKNHIIKRRLKTGRYKNFLIIFHLNCSINSTKGIAKIFFSIANFLLDKLTKKALSSLS